MKAKYLICFFIAIHTAAANNKFIRHYAFNWLEKSPKVAEYYLIKSLPNPESAYILGTLYFGGYEGIPANLKKADWFLTISANQNYPAAINSIGDGYYGGDIREKNLKKALEYYERAAKLGLGAAQFNAGVTLLNSGNTAYELKKAIFWLDKASKNSDDLEMVTISAKKYKISAKNKLKKLLKSKI